MFKGVLFELLGTLWIYLHLFVVFFLTVSILLVQVVMILGDDVDFEPFWLAMAAAVPSHFDFAAILPCRLLAVGCCCWLQMGLSVVDFEDLPLTRWSKTLEKQVIVQDRPGGSGAPPGRLVSQPARNKWW